MFRLTFLAVCAVLLVGAAPKNAGANEAVTTFTLDNGMDVGGLEQQMFQKMRNPRGALGFVS